jgi:hypothetical protein
MTARRTTRWIILVALFLACGSTEKPEPYISPAAYVALGPDAKLVFLPSAISIEVNGKRATDAAAQEAELAIRGALEGALALEHLGQRYVFASGEAAELAARDVRRWLQSIEVCAETSDAQQTAAPSVRAATDAVGGTTAVLIDARLHATSKGRKAGQVAAGTFIAAAGVAIVALAVVAAIEKGDSPSCSDAQVSAAVEVTDVVAQAAIEGMEASRIAPVCSQPMAPVGSDEHGFWTGNHLDLSVAVLGTDGELLWYRAGKIPLDATKPEEASRRLTGFMHGMP